MQDEDFMTFSAKVQKIHRIIVPGPVRGRLGIDVGDYVEVKIKRLPNMEKFPLRE